MMSAVYSALSSSSSSPSSRSPPLPPPSARPPSLALSLALARLLAPVCKCVIEAKYGAVGCRRRSSRIRLHGGGGHPLAGSPASRTEHAERTAPRPARALNPSVHRAREAAPEGRPGASPELQRKIRDSDRPEGTLPSRSGNLQRALNFSAPALRRLSPLRTNSGSFISSEVSSEELEPTQMPLNRRVDDKNVVHLHNGVLFSGKERWHYELCRIVEKYFLPLWGKTCQVSAWNNLLWLCNNPGKFGILMEILMTDLQACYHKGNDHRSRNCSRVQHSGKFKEEEETIPHQGLHSQRCEEESEVRRPYLWLQERKRQETHKETTNRCTPGSLAPP